MKSFFLLIAIFVFVTSTKQSLAQQRQIDSLKVLIAKSNNDSLKIELYKTICEVCVTKDNLKYGTEALKFIEDFEAKKKKKTKKYFFKISFNE